LIEHSIRDRDDVVYYQATETTKQVQLDDFVAEAARTFCYSWGTSRISCCSSIRT